MRRVITYGTFDLLHYGHINLLRRAREQGDYLIVALSTDEFNWNEKQKKSYFSYEDRKRMLEAIRYVDLVIPEESWDQKITDVDKYHVDVFVMGDDWKGKFDFLKDEPDAAHHDRRAGHERGVDDEPAICVHARDLPTQFVPLYGAGGKNMPPANLCTRTKSWSSGGARGGKARLG